MKMLKLQTKIKSSIQWMLINNKSNYQLYFLVNKYIRINIVCVIYALLIQNKMI